jgi:hypothetical protein
VVWRNQNSFHGRNVLYFSAARWNDLGLWMAIYDPTNMGVVQHFAFDLVRALNDKRSLKIRRKKAG